MEVYQGPIYINFQKVKNLFNVSFRNIGAYTQLAHPIVPFNALTCLSRMVYGRKCFFLGHYSL